MRNLFVLNKNRARWKHAVMEWLHEDITPPDLTLTKGTVKCWDTKDEMHDTVKIEWDTEIGHFWRFKCPTCGWESITRPLPPSGPTRRR